MIPLVETYASETAPAFVQAACLSYANGIARCDGHGIRDAKTKTRRCPTHFGCHVEHRVFVLVMVSTVLGDFGPSTDVTLFYVTTQLQGGK